MENKEQELIAQYIDDQEVVDQGYDEIPIPLSFDGILDEDEEAVVQYDTDKFRKGVKDYSYIAGAFCALRNSGMSEEATMSLLLSEIEMKALSKQLEGQEKITKIKADALIKEEI